MKQIITNLKVLLTLALLCGVSSVWAVEKTITVPLKGFCTNSSTSYLNKNVPSTHDGVDFVAYAFNNSSGQIRGNKTSIYGDDMSNVEDANSNFHIFNSSAIPGSITKIVLKVSDGKLQNKMYVAVGKESKGTVTAITGLTGVAPSDNSFTFEFDASDGYTFFKLCSNEKFTSGTVKAGSDDAIVITYEDGKLGTEPSISASNINLASDAISGEIAYTISNPVSGVSLTASSTADWISDISVTAEKVTFKTTANTGSTDRQATVTLKYEGASDKNVTVTQAKYIPVYANLAALLAAETPTADGKTVQVTLTNEKITKIYVTSKDQRNGIYLKVGDKEIEVFCYDVPESWEVGGTVSGTLTCPWKIYNETWELCPSSWKGLTYTAPSIEKYQINIDNLTNGTITASAEEAVEGAEITLTITPNAHYALKDGSLVVLNETTSDEITVTNNKFTMPASDVLVSAEFVEVPKYTVLYSVLGEDAGSEDVYANEFIAAAPTVKEMAGWKFAGWTTNDKYESSTAAPTFFTASTPVVEDVILYAVFKKVENGTGEVWNLVEDASTLQSNDVIRLAATVSGASKAENNGTFAASAFGEGGKFFTSTSASIEDNQLTATGAIDITLDRTINGWTLTTSEGVVGTKTAKAMLLDNTDAGTINEWTISIENGAATITAGDKGRILYNRDSPRFLNYTSNTSASQVLPSIFRKEVSGTTTYALNIPMYYDLTMSSTGYATLYLDYPSAIPYGFKAYRAEAIGGTKIKLQEIQDNVPANFGVLVKGEANATATFKGFYLPEGMIGGVHNLFRGVVEDTDVADVKENTIYVLNAAESTDANPKFSQYTGSTLNANKAYLDIEAPAGANLTFVFGDATGIDTVETVKAATTRVNLAGQVVGKDYKGVVIENGKKFLNK